MRRVPLIAALLLGSALLTSGCDEKGKKCDAAFTAMMETATAQAKAIGMKEEDLKAKVEAYKGTFVEKCKQLPDEAIACLNVASLKDPKCLATLAKHRDLLKMPK